jgi:hypothetical protein
MSLVAEKVARRQEKRQCAVNVFGEKDNALYQGSQSLTHSRFCSPNYCKINEEVKTCTVTGTEENGNSLHCSKRCAVDVRLLVVTRWEWIWRWLGGDVFDQ